MKWGTSAAVYADDVNVLGDNIDAIKKNIQTIIDVCNEVSLEVNAEKTSFMLMSHHQNVGQNHNVKMENKSSDNVPLDSNPKTTALARASSNCKRQTRPLVIESAPHQQTRKCLTVIKI
jgi:hypothetical protein